MEVLIIITFLIFGISAAAMGGFCSLRALELTNILRIDTFNVKVPARISVAVFFISTAVLVMLNIMH